MTKKFNLRLLVVFTSLAGCATETEWPSLQANQAFVLYDRSPPPFCGRCETRKYTVTYDGIVYIEQGYWAGNYRNWRTRRWKKEIPFNDLQQFLDLLKPYRPNSELEVDTPESCEDYHFDDAELKIIWNDEFGKNIRIFDYGCDGIARKKMFDDFRSALNLIEG